MRLSEQKKLISEDDTKQYDYVRVLSKLSFKVTHDELDKLTKQLKLFLEETVPNQKSVFDKSCLDSLKHIYNDISLTLIRVSNEYERLYESKLN